MLKICEIKTSVSNEVEADRLARGLIDAKLAACVQVATGHSHYRWQGEVARNGECFLAIKTSMACSEAAMVWIAEHHPYDLPEVLCHEWMASDAYGRWVEAETQDAATRSHG